MSLFRVIDETTKTDVTDSLMEIVCAAQRDGEPWASGLVWCDMEGWALLEDGTLAALDECGNWSYAPERYKAKRLPRKQLPDGAFMDEV